MNTQTITPNTAREREAATASAAERPVRDHTLALTLSYNGAPFSGFARQPGQTTVQGDLEDALRLLFKRDIETTCAGRTDAGVHALGQMVSFDVDDVDLAGRSLPSLRRSLNALTHDAITVREVEPKQLGFSARFDAQAREYHYHLCVDSTCPIFMKDFSWFVPGGLDMSAMEPPRSTCGDTTSRASAWPPRPRESPRTATSAKYPFIPKRSWGRTSSPSRWWATRSSILVRTMVGTLVMVGRGQRPASWVADVLEARDRQAAGENAPAQGLVFWRVMY
ncbi:MAG: tRNA pseudouridine synthase A [Eggerthellaceae bacterium]